jgi:hypothetical protein
VGLSVNVKTLVANEVFGQPVHGSILGVVPLTRSGATSFAVDAEGTHPSFPRTVDARAPFVLGVTDEGLARVVGGKVDVIWPGKSADPTITPIDIALAGETGHAAAFRHGGEKGKVLVGWLDVDGARWTGLQAIETQRVLVGPPAVASGNGTVLAAFAAKSSLTEPWRLELAVAPVGSLPERSTPLQVPPGGPGGDATFPSVASLPGDRFLLQWAEGAAGGQVVRAQVISSRLVPEGEAARLSALDQDASRGTPFVVGGNALALFLVRKAITYELWGASLRCQ